MAKGIPSKGCVLSISIPGSPTNFAAVANVTGFNGPSGSLATIDVTSLDDDAIQKIAGLLDEGQFTFDLNIDPDNAQHILLHDARLNKTLSEFKLALSDATPKNIYFIGYVTAFPFSGPLGEKVTTQVTIEITDKHWWA